MHGYHEMTLSIRVSLRVAWHKLAFSEIAPKPIHLAALVNPLPSLILRTFPVEQSV